MFSTLISPKKPFHQVPNPDSQAGQPFVQFTTWRGDSADPLADFLAEACTLDPHAHVESATLWHAYLAWCEGRGEQPAWKHISWFTRNLAQRDGITMTRTKKQRLMLGIEIGDAMTR